jgi:uncharacterized protein YjiS (DUF1127 family)
METMTAIVIADVRSSRHTIEEAPKPSLAGRLYRWARRAAADRNLRDQLAQMDDAMLRDIGIAPDEFYRVRSRERFTPRAWRAAHGA